MRGLVLSIGGAALLVIASVGPATADPAGLCETLARVSKIEVPREQHEGVFKGVLDLFDCPVP